LKRIILLSFILLMSCEEDAEEVASIDVIAVTPLQTIINVGQTVQFVGQALDIDLVPVPDIAFVWSSSDPTRVQVDENGLATGMAMAQGVVITAQTEGIESNDAVIHVAGEPHRIELGFTSEAVLAGQSITLSGDIKDSLGTTIPEMEISDWLSADESLLLAEASGELTGVSKGTTTVMAELGNLQSDPVQIYIWDLAFTEDFSSVDTSTIGEYYFRGNNDMIWQINHELETDTSAAGPHTGRPAIVEDNGNPVLRLTEPSNAYFTNRQLLIMTYGGTVYDSDFGWPTGDGMLTNSNFRIQMRINGIDDPVASTTAESLVIFTQYYSGAASPYYLVYGPGRNRVSAWFGASLAPSASIPEWGAMPEIDYDTWFNMVVEVFDGTMRTEVFSGAEPTGEWDYSYTIPDWTGEEESIPGLWFGAFLVDEYYADDIKYYAP